MEVKLIDHMGTDLSVVNAARISFGKRKEVFDESDEKLIKYLAKNGHFSPLCHNSITFDLSVPLCVSNIISSHKIGFVFTEKLRNYENYTRDGLGSWYLTGNIYSFSNLYNFHMNECCDIKWILEHMNTELSNLFPVSWKALTKK